jgi:hypothetical protein
VKNKMETASGKHSSASERKQSTGAAGEEKEKRDLGDRVGPLVFE